LGAWQDSLYIFKLQIYGEKEGVALEHKFSVARSIEMFPEGRERSPNHTSSFASIFAAQSFNLHRSCINNMWELCYYPQNLTIHWTAIPCGTVRLLVTYIAWKLGGP
jgi:hypothetical protein